MTAADADGACRDVALEHVFNLRDLGGYPTTDGRRIRWGRVYRGAGLQRLTGADLETVRELGWATVIDLRTDREIDATGMCPGSAAQRPVVHRPMIRTTWDRALLDPAQPTEEFLRDRYRDMLCEGAGTIREVIELLASDDGLPAVFYCAAGKDRTGVMAAVLHDVLGVDHDTIARDYHLSKERVDRIRARAHAHAEATMVAQPEAFMQAPAGAMSLLLTWLARAHGGAEGYLLSVGVTPEVIAALRARLTEPIPT